MSEDGSLLDEQIRALCERGQLDRALYALFHKKDQDQLQDDLYVSLLKACHKRKALAQAKLLHAHLLHHRSLSLSSKLGEYLLLTLAKCGGIQEARQLFQRLPRRTVYSWTALISALTDCGRGQEALRMHECMQEEGVEPNKYTFVSLFKACGSLARLKEGRKLHAEARRHGLASDIFISSTLVSMYGKCGAIEEAETVFSTSPERDIVSWNAMLSAYVEQKQGEKAFLLYRQMQEEGVSPDQHTFLMALQPCGTLAEEEEAIAVQGMHSNTTSLQIGRALHADARKNGFASDVFVGTALVTMYAKCEAIQEAENVFGTLSERDATSWNAMLSAYVDQGQAQKALQSYKHMQRQSVILDDVTLTCILQACSDTGSSVISKELHFIIVSASLELNLPLTATLIHAYGSCTSMVDAQAVFDWLPHPDVVSWTACIAGYARDGNCVASLEMFVKSQQHGINPDGVMLGSVLSTCSLSGLVDEGLNHTTCMRKDYSIAPNLNHYNLMIDLLGRAGDFKRIENLLGRILMQADLTIWLSLLGACCIHGNMELGKLAFDHAVKLQPEEAITYVLMSNIYADAGMQECVGGAEVSRKDEAWPHTKYAASGIGEDAKNWSVFNSEKLAIAFGD